MKNSSASCLPLLALAPFALTLAACGSGDAENADGAPVPTFSLAWSEYPSWSVFGVADEIGLIDGKKGAMGELETKWNVDVELKQADYDSCITYYASSTADAACLTNMDSLNPSLSRKTVGILPTSTSMGADALIAVGANSIQDLKGKPVLGLEKSVSEYCFVRNLELLGEKEADYTFTNMDPGAAAMGMQQQKGGHEAIVVWNPFVLDTLAKRTDAKVIFDSSTIPGEILDMVVMGADSLAKEGGDRFAACIADTFYEFAKRADDPAQRSEMLVALGEKFSDLDAAAMEKVLEATVFYKDADAGLAVFNGEEVKATMTKVTDFCTSHGIVDKAPAIGYGKGVEGDFVFDPSYIEAAKAK
jgi:NitT/TauT family transport system substrate-binding protein